MNEQLKEDIDFLRWAVRTLNVSYDAMEPHDWANIATRLSVATDRIEQWIKEFEARPKAVEIPFRGEVR